MKANLKAKRFTSGVWGVVICFILLVSMGIVLPRPVNAGNTVTIGIDPSTSTATLNQNFAVDIKVTITDSENVTGVQAYLTFDPTKLEVESITKGAAIGSWMEFMHSGWDNYWNNTSGQIFYSVAAMPSPVMNQTFVAATIEFKALAVTGSTPLTFVTEGSIKTKVSYAGGSVLDEVVNGTVAISQAVISKIAFTTPARTVMAGQVSAVMTVQTQSAAGAAVSVTSNTTITLNSTSTGGTFYSDVAGSTVITSVSISSGTSSASFYYKDTTAGTPTITADESPSLGWTVASQPVTVNPAPVGTISKIVFTTVPQTLAAGQVSAVMTIQTQDSSSNAVNVTSNTTINLISTSGNGKFYSDVAGSIQITSVSISSGANSASFYYKDTAVGTAMITADESPSQGWTAATQVETVNAGAISKLVFTTAARIGSLSLTAGVVSGVMTIQTQNAYGVVVNVTSVTTITLNSTSATGKFYSDAAGTSLITSVIISTGANSASFYYKDTKASDLSITAAESPSQGWTDASQAEKVKAAAAAKLVVSGITDPVEAGTACTVTVTAVDAYGNTDTTYAGTIHFTSSDAQATLPGNYTFVAATDNGSHSFVGGVILETAGEQSVTATDAVTSSITGQQAEITVTGGGGGANWAAIIGGTIGGLLLIGIIVYLLRRRQRV